jgi:LmbE family N-acetylglucosaminyl deacetylase
MELIWIFMLTLVSFLLVAAIASATILFIFHQPFLPSIFQKYKFKSGERALFVYPHPDDETVSAGSLIVCLIKKGLHVKIVSVTKGEKGDELVKVGPEELKTIRTAEFAQSMKVLGAEDFELLDMGDGQLKSKMTELKVRVNELIKQFDPQFIVTYEQGGVYGHPDHVALSRVVDQLSKEYPAKSFIYSSAPNYVLKNIELPTFMADEVIKHSPIKYKLSCLETGGLKLTAIQQYKSQKIMARLPKAFSRLIGMYEYYTDEFEAQI